MLGRPLWWQTKKFVLVLATPLHRKSTRVPSQKWLHLLKPPEKYSSSDRFPLIPRENKSPLKKIEENTCPKLDWVPLVSLQPSVYPSELSGAILSPCFAVSISSQAAKGSNPQPINPNHGAKRSNKMDQRVQGQDSTILRVTAPFFPEILLSRTPPKTLGKQPIFEKDDG